MKRSAFDRRALLALLLLAAILLGVWGAIALPGRWRRHSGHPDANEAMDAFLWRQRIERDEHGRIPREGLPAALAQRERLVRSDFTASLAKTAGLGGHWAFRGPSNVGGRTRAILIDPRKPAHLWAGSVSGGLFVSQNSGKSWAPVNDFLPSLAVSSLAADPTDPDTFYVGTGEGFFNGDSLTGLGIFVTHDGGASFQQLGATAAWGDVNRIAVSPADPSTLLAATQGGIFRSTDGGNTWTQSTVPRSLQVAFNPRVPNEALASQQGASQVHQILFSSDGGTTWTVASALADVEDRLARIEIAYAPSDGTTAYANQDGNVWKSTDGGRSWNPVGQSNDGNWYSNAVWVSPTDPNLVLVGGVQLLRSVNGGQSFAPIANGYILTQQVHPDVHFITADPGYNGKSNRRVYVGCDGGVFVTDNVQTVTTRKGWRSLNGGYATTQYYSGVGDGPTALLFGGLQDNGTLRLQKTATATLTYGGDGGFVAIDRQIPTYVYGEYISLSNLFRSKDGGKHLEAFIADGLGEQGQGNFIAPLVLDPTDGTRMLAGAHQLWLSTDVRTAKSPSWTPIKPAVSDQAGVENVSAIAISAADPNRIWVGHNNGQLYVTTDGRSPSPDWQTVDDNGGHNPLPDRYITRIAASWQDPNVAWVSFGGRTPDNLWRTDDGGQTWHSVAGQLPQITIMGIAQHPTHPDWLYVGTEVGVFASEDGGESWSTVNEGPGNVEVDDITFLNRSTTLLAATHGRGLWTINVP
ncbi:MAG TPA: hypothetical protein VIE43_03045 [Thermoanaerobaculia bacterium]|nr:hypothetical protein [Thermoanaerobaculia bacterium]